MSQDTVADINAIANNKQIIIPERTLQYYDWVGDGYIIIDPETGASNYLISGGLSGGSNAEEWDPLKDPLLEFLRALGISTSQAKIKLLIKNNPGLEGAINFFRKAVSHAGLAIGAIISFSDMYTDTGSLWKSIAAAAVTVMFGILIAKMLPFFMAAFAGTGIGVVIIIAWFFLAMYVMEKLILNFIKEVYFFIRQRLKYYADKGIILEDIYA